LKIDQADRKAIAVAWIGTFGVLSLTWLFFSAQEIVYAFASLGGSAVIVFGMPDSEMSRPRSLFGGHAIGAGTGIVFLNAFGHGPLSIAAAVATALALMQIGRAIHSPAGADPIIVMMSSLAISTVLIELAMGLLLLWIAGILLLNAFGIRAYGHTVPVIGPLAIKLNRRAVRSAAEKRQTPS
jgi:CBS-domain-containing membrane protein